MPRYRFNWNNFDTSLLRALRDALRLEGDPVDALRSGYGARPRVDFVRDSWPVLLSNWLAHDRASAKRVAGTLRQRGVGDVTNRNDLEFLSSLRNTSGMRQIVLEAFIERGEQSDEDRQLVRTLSVDTATPPVESPVPAALAPPAAPADTGPDSDGDGAPVPDLPESVSLMLYLIGALTEHLGDNFEVDKDGDLAIPSGSAVVYVSVIAEPLLVRVFSPMVLNVPLSFELLTLLNSLNSKVPFGRFLHTNDAVFLEHNVFPVGLTAAEIVIIINSIRAAADHFDHQIRERFGGDVALLERAEDEIDV
jgi:hypothetical protein